MKKYILLLSVFFIFTCAQYRNVQKVNFLLSLDTDAQYYTQNLPKNHVPLVVNEQVAHYVKIYTEECRQYLTKVLQRAYKYFPMMKVAFQNEGLPEELVYLPIIESGFNMDAYSYKQASGPWQFIKGTGKLYGLHCDWWVDERRNPEKSTIAAV